MEKIGWTDRVRNEEVLHRDKEKRNMLYTVKRRKANWIGQIICNRRKDRGKDRSGEKTEKKTYTCIV